MTIIVELNIIPLGMGASVSKFLASAIKELERHDVTYEVTPMCTVFEAANVEEAFQVVKATHEAVFSEDVKRVVTTVKIDDRRDVQKGMKAKVTSLMQEARK